MAVETTLQVLVGKAEKLTSIIKFKPCKSDTKCVRKIDVRRNPRSHQIKSLKALVRIDTHIINMTIDTGSPVSFLNWTTAKQLLQQTTNPKTECNLYYFSVGRVGSDGRNILGYRT